MWMSTISISVANYADAYRMCFKLAFSIVFLSLHFSPHTPFISFLTLLFWRGGMGEEKLSHSILVRGTCPSIIDDVIISHTLCIWKGSV